MDGVRWMDAGVSDERGWMTATVSRMVGEVSVRASEERLVDDGVH